MIQRLSDCGAGARMFGRNEIIKALRKHGVSLEGAVAVDVQARAAVLWGPSDLTLRVLGDDGTSHSVDDYLFELKHDTKYSSEFPSSHPPRISKDDIERLSANQAKIAKGEVIVVDDRNLRVK